MTVTDTYGGATTRTFDIEVENAAPTITDILGETNINEGEELNLSAIASDPGNDPLTYIYSQQSPPFEGKSVISHQSSVSHTFTDDGIYDLILTVTDDENASTRACLQTVILSKITQVNRQRWRSREASAFGER